MSLIYKTLLSMIGPMDAENVHHRFVSMLKLVGKRARRPAFKRLAKVALQSPEIKTSRPALKVFGLEFSHPVGLAAGLDKNGEAIEGLSLLNFSFLELGTVTPKAQAGNPRPRLFRNYREQIIFNAMGFNNLGAEALKAHIENARPHISPSIILGANIGKNASTPLEAAARDYRECARILNRVADYFTVNISSPNTKGLRGLQNFETLAPILEGVLAEAKKSARIVPVLVKLAPEISEDLFAELISRIESQFPIDGWILTNTLQRDCPWPESAMKIGGISGAPLKKASLDALRLGLRYSKKPIISSGGILTSADAQERLDIGASLIQIYSGLIFSGPALISECAKKLNPNTASL